MVQFLQPEEFQRGGVCDKILSETPQTILDIVHKTRDTGKEYIINIIEHDDGMVATDPIGGTETSITGDKAAKSMMDALTLASDVVAEGGSVGSDEIKRHQIHTHPEGHVGISLSDMRSFADDIVTGGDIPESELVAVKRRENEVMLGGLYRTRDMSSSEVEEIQHGLSIANLPERAQMSHRQKEDELLSAMRKSGIETCSSAIKDR